jgi:hypothetical protein
MDKNRDRADYLLEGFYQLDKENCNE